MTEQSGELITKRYQVPPEFFGGPLDVGYYLNTSTGGATAPGQQRVEPQLLASGYIDKEAATYKSAVAVGAGGGGEITSGQGTATTRQQLINDRQVVRRADAKTFLQSMGVAFPAYPEGCIPGDKDKPCREAASATFFPHSGMLVVRNTADNLDMIDALVEQASASVPKQAEIEARFME